MPAFVSLVVLSGVVYVASWSGWLATSGGYDRDWGAKHPDAAQRPGCSASRSPRCCTTRRTSGTSTPASFINHAQHAYRANPAGWLVVARPIGIDAVNAIKPGTDGCVGPDNCIRVISGIGTPALWWVAVFALIAAAILWVRRPGLALRHPGGRGAGRLAAVVPVHGADRCSSSTRSR